MTYQRYTLDKSITEIFKEHIPNKIIKERQQGKEKLSYVSGSVILDMINKATNYNWDFIVEERWIQESRDKFNPKYDKEPVPQGPVAHVYGYLELNFIDENNTPVTIRKHAFGSKPIIGGQNEQKDIFKSAMTDAIKKAASMIGIGLQLWRDDSGINAKLLFHGAKAEIDGEIDLHHGRQNNDFGQGFYTGESYEQAISFVSGFDNSSVYYLSFNDINLKCKRYEVNQKWMMTIAYYKSIGLDTFIDILHLPMI